MTLGSPERSASAINEAKLQQMQKWYEQQMHIMEMMRDLHSGLYDLCVKFSVPQYSSDPDKARSRVETVDLVQKGVPKDSPPHMSIPREELPLSKEQQDFLTSLHECATEIRRSNQRLRDLVNTNYHRRTATFWSHCWNILLRRCSKLSRMRNALSEMYGALHTLEENATKGIYVESVTWHASVDSDWISTRLNDLRDELNAYREEFDALTSQKDEGNPH